MSDITIAYGENYSVPLASIPLGNVAVLVARSISHKMGNEVSSSLKAFRDRTPEATEADIQAKHRELLDATWTRITTGDLGTVTRASAPKAPAMSPLEAETRALVQATILALATEKKVKFVPAKRKTAKSEAIEAHFVYGNGTTQTLETAINQWLADPVKGPKAEADAAKALAAKARIAAAAVKEAAESGDDAGF